MTSINSQSALSIEPSSSHIELSPAPQIFGSEPRDEETEVWFVDIAYDEIPERHYKESEVKRERECVCVGGGGVEPLTSGRLFVCIYGG